MTTTAHPGRGGELAAVLLTVAERLRGFPGCEIYLISQDGTDPDTVHVAEAWQDDAGAQAALASASRRRPRPLRRPCPAVGPAAPHGPHRPGRRGPPDRGPTLTNEPPTTGKWAPAQPIPCSKPSESKAETWLKTWKSSCSNLPRHSSAGWTSITPPRPASG
ncbi:putative quinol monooxygenase [Streptomyces sp. NPDC096152]|uniref:putative quinol monooxygenase n=1 Tax=Streptomyces sp. NPDC096152 TaxID=3366078 RepID=UPI00382B2E4B